MTTYSINATDSNTPAAWMRLPCITSMTPDAQDGGRCRWTVETTDAERLERALNKAADVLEYEAL